MTVKFDHGKSRAAWLRSEVEKEWPLYPSTLFEGATFVCTGWPPQQMRQRVYKFFRGDAQLTDYGVLQAGDIITAVVHTLPPSMNFASSIKALNLTPLRADPMPAMPQRKTQFR
mmetsp:Transcript_120643/g.225430  ORF Transcript_120643/g.225430 Transcript_120643/m.225430 type:complete len:114 (-) Transcript_120643:99-440(-)